MLKIFFIDQTRNKQRKQKKIGHRRKKRIYSVEIGIQQARMSA